MEKIKLFIESDRGKDILTVLIVILVGLASFELGRLSKEGSSEGIKITYPNQPANAVSGVDEVSYIYNSLESTAKNTTGNYFASKRGKKYYTLGCSAGKSIKQENRVYFMTQDLAQKAGYELSTSCN